MPNYPGQLVYGKHPLRDSEMELTDKLTDEQRQKMIGGDKYRLMGPAGYAAWGEPYTRVYGTPAPTMHVIGSNEPLIYRSIVNNDPNHPRALITWAANLMVRSGNTRLVYEALTSPNLELSVSLELTHTPSSELADYVIPSASCFERPCMTTWEDFADAVCFGEKAIEPIGERRDDFFFWRGLGLRLGQKEYWPWETHEEVIEYRAAPVGLKFKELVEMGGLRPEPEYRKYEKRGFATNSGKFELYSTVLEKLGYDPLPYYKEPPESPVSMPEVAEEYPYILITGGRGGPQYLSEFHQFDTGLRERHPYPVMDINTSAARKLDIRNGDWVYIETRRGKIKQMAHVTDGLPPNVVNCHASWWYPEMPAEAPSLFGIWESSANILTQDDPEACDEMVGGWVNRAMLCKVYKVEVK